MAAGKDVGVATVEEIRSQPQVWSTVLGDLAEQDLATLRPDSRGSIVFTGCGSTYYLALWAARRCRELTGAPCTAVPASELVVAPALFLGDTPPLLVVISRSGETTESVRAAERLRGGGSAVLVITCYPESSLVQLADVSLVAPAAQEESVAQTRTFTSMMLCCLGWLTGGTGGAAAVLEEAAASLLERVDDQARQLAGDEGRRFFFLGMGARYGLACEAMLKMKEMSLSYSEAYHTLEFRHGPMSVVDRSSLVVGLLPADSSLERAVLRDMAGLGAATVVFGGSDGDAQQRIALPADVSEPWADVLYMPGLQLLAWHRAIQRGLDPDRPTNLTSVVVLEED